MKAKPKYKSDAYEAIHSSAQALFAVGGINKATLRNFDESCVVVPAVIEPEQIKKNPRTQPCESASFCALSQYNRIDCLKVGEWR